ncbi:hypothetical protein PtrSN002B_002597 [Pyrenophora tritici-repentis]|nr:hypothetical protein PtrV1_02075 [Pyrenophora tritici-repentis]KAF7454812.1 hypothetical protein A1F99_020700 [Pyrenophora tritici-repentis]KAI1543631.1 hypothetical protein PtrSN001A_002982 [Pyrenophora tritici-repentis]KAI1546875.1 hypothetical protein PtrSN001C_002663 [Pyrenophora tritici-repentis]KAI1555932.1 hypothetical protein PtrSN002B_002597 [Pyrenophora tritici-repentis]
MSSIDMTPEMLALGTFFDKLKEWDAGVMRYTAPLDKMSDDDIHRACALYFFDGIPSHARMDIDVLERGFAVIGKTSNMWDQRPNAWWFHKECVTAILRENDEKGNGETDALFLLFKRLFPDVDWAGRDRKAMQDGDIQFSRTARALMVSPTRYLKAFRDGENIEDVLAEKERETRCSRECDGKTPVELKKLCEWLREPKQKMT